jgi:hypothetical protein
MSRVPLPARLIVAGLVLWVSTLAAAASKMPPWVAEPPRDTAETMWGVGEGTDLEAARRNALRAVSARLRSAVSGTLTDQTVVTNGKVDRTSSSAVSEEVLKTEFSRADVQSSAAGGLGVFALVKVDRQVFLRDTRTRLEVLTKPILEAEAGLTQQSTLEQFIALRRVSSQIDSAIALSQLLAGAGAEREGQDGVAHYGTLRERARLLSSRLTFELRAGAADADIAAAVGAFLSEQGMRSAIKRTPGANVLSIDSQSRQDELFGSKLLKLTVRLAVVDDQGRAVANREYAVSGSSRYDYRGARDAAIVKLAGALHDAGPLAALGFKE